MGNNDHIRTVVEFRQDGKPKRSLCLKQVLPSVQIGQTIAFDHPSMSQCLSGEVTNISHVVFVSEDPPMTYIDVEVKNA